MANTLKDLEWQMVAVKSIKSLFVATSGYDNVDEVEHQISSIGVKVKLIVAQEISEFFLTYGSPRNGRTTANRRITGCSSH
jgi:hypothetical protein